MRRIESTEPEGVRFVPDEPSGDAVLVLAGSSGRIDEDRARVFAEHGCLAESIRWFGGPGQSPGPWDVPLETFLARLEDLGRDAERVHVVGTSYGSEAALWCGAASPRVAGVVAFAPSDVVWAGNGPGSSHWTLGGEAVPFVPFDWSGHEAEDPPRFRPVYERSRLTHADRIPAATIPVERIGALVLVAGGDDQVWPAVAHAERIRGLREAAGRPTELVVSATAGHRTILPGETPPAGGMTMRRGGNEAADRELGVRAWAAITAMLAAGRASGAA